LSIRRTATLLARRRFQEPLARAAARQGAKACPTPARAESRLESLVLARGLMAARNTAERVQDK